MKKALSLALALVLAFALAIPAFAETVNATEGNFTDKTGNTTVTYSVSGKYTISIPANFPLDAAGDGTADIGVSDVLIPTGKTLTVKLTTENYADSKNYLKDGTKASSISYTITSKVKDSQDTPTAVTNDAAFITVAAGSKAGETRTLTFDANIAEATLMGEHTDIITFTAHVG